MIDVQCYYIFNDTSYEILSCSEQSTQTFFFFLAKDKAVKTVLMVFNNLCWLLEQNIFSVTQADT